MGYRDDMVSVRTPDGWTKPMARRELQGFLERTGTAYEGSPLITTSDYEKRRDERNERRRKKDY